MRHLQWTELLFCCCFWNFSFPYYFFLVFVYTYQFSLLNEFLQTKHSELTIDWYYYNIFEIRTLMMQDVLIHRYTLYRFHYNNISVDCRSRYSQIKFFQRLLFWGSWSCYVPFSHYRTIKRNERERIKRKHTWYDLFFTSFIHFKKIEN